MPISHGHHNMKRIHPSDTEFTVNHDGVPHAMEIYCVDKGNVRFRPSGHPEGAMPVTLKIQKFDFLPVEVIQVYATGTTVSEMYGIWGFSDN